MPYEFSQKGQEMLADVKSFMDDHIYPNEVEYRREQEEVGPRQSPPMLEKLKAAARERGL